MTDTSIHEPVLSLAGLPAHLVDWLSAVVAAATGAAEGSPDAGGGSVGKQDAARASAGLLVAAARSVQAWAEGVEVEAIGRLVRSIEDDPGIDVGQHESRSTRQTRVGLARTAAAVELQLLTGLPLTQCRDRVALASACPARGDYLRLRMAAGTLGAWRAVTLLKETRHLDPLAADEITRQALRPIGLVAPEETADPARAAEAELAAVLAREPLSQATFRRRLARALTLAESSGQYAHRRAHEARDLRDAQTAPDSHGMACTTVTASRERAFAAQQRVTQLARRARAAGDGRTLAQLRSDIATDLLIRGQVPGDALLADAPPARLQVVVSLATLLDKDGVAEVPGAGFLTAEQVRRVAVAEGSVWCRLVTDPTTGSVIDAASTYRPPAAMRRAVQARDQRCRAPGCEHPATECDLDHVVTWNALACEPAHGATHPDNLHALHRAHHVAKTRGWWRSTQSAGGIVHWTTLTGRRITTRPMNHHDLTDLPGLPGGPASLIERALAVLIEDATDPLPLSPAAAALETVVVSRREPVVLVLSPPDPPSPGPPPEPEDDQPPPF
ncbi:hypothetical protein PZ938_05885 [Luteipulveratus sp. YIM 133132]|uniref:HNH endonuclease signature motif containing protein n=1 Tax=Luteipulveratus flavus TaxID=3031728 RepID=UPI0023B0C72F|nr:HNH endonuclease signature motif containing protein [Luteipulveratus sp. YIM 133132]MDE9365133.1 hypothetical protein [Luteipulveratus sp. YIM 133132]